EGPVFRFDHRVIGVGGYPGDGKSGDDIGAALPEQGGELDGHLAVIDDTGLRHPDTADGAAMGFELLHLPAVEHADVMQIVFKASIENPVEYGQLGGSGSCDHFAAEFVGNLVVVTKPEQHIVSGYAVDCFGASGGVIDTGVDDAAIAICLV